MTCDERKDDIFLYAAGSLERAERTVLETHLGTGCVRCAERLAAAEATLAEVSLSLDPVEPSPSVWEGLRVRVANEGAPREGAAATASAGTGWLPVALAAGLAAIAAAGLGAMLSYRLVALPAEDELRRLQEVQQTLVTEQEELLEQVAEQDAEMAEFEEELTLTREQIDLLRKPGLQVLALAGTDLQPQAAARVFWEWEDYACYLHARGLKRSAIERTYALWLFTDAEEVIRVGTFEPDALGGATLFAKLPKDIGRVVRTVVTEEPLEVGDQPSGPVHLAGEADAPPTS